MKIEYLLGTSTVPHNAIKTHEIGSSYIFYSYILLFRKSCSSFQSVVVRSPEVVVSSCILHPTPRIRRVWTARGHSLLGRLNRLMSSMTYNLHPNVQAILSRQVQDGRMVGQIRDPLTHTFQTPNLFMKKPTTIVVVVQATRPICP